MLSYFCKAPCWKNAGQLTFLSKVIVPKHTSTINALDLSDVLVTLEGTGLVIFNAIQTHVGVVRITALDLSESNVVDDILVCLENMASKWRDNLLDGTLPFISVCHIFG